MNTEQTVFAGVPSIVSTKGTHIVADFYDCRSELLDDEQYLTDLLVQAAEKAKATVLGKTSHSFDPHGVTILILLAESHISIHTWPEKGYAAVDVMTCGENMQPQIAIDTIVKALESAEVKQTLITRGDK